jgi:PII-like signaling protein
MEGLTGERVLMRVHIGERDKHDGKPLYHAIVEMLRARGYAGATVLRGIMGFGATSKLHTDRFLELSTDLPIIVECIETKERIDAILPELDAMIGGGLITLERAQVVIHRAGT